MSSQLRTMPFSSGYCAASKRRRSVAREREKKNSPQRAKRRRRPHCDLEHHAQLRRLVADHDVFDFDVVDSVREARRRRHGARANRSARPNKKTQDFFLLDTTRAPPQREPRRVCARAPPRQTYFSSERRIGRPTIDGKMAVGKLAPAKPHLTNCAATASAAAAANAPARGATERK